VIDPLDVSILELNKKIESEIDFPLIIYGLRSELEQSSILISLLPEGRLGI
jgi:hypothetical protein